MFFGVFWAESTWLDGESGRRRSVNKMVRVDAGGGVCGVGVQRGKERKRQGSSKEGGGKE